MNRFWLATSAAAALTAAALLAPRPATVEAKRPGGVMVNDDGQPGGLEFRLGEGQGDARPYERVPPAAAQVLGDADTRRVLGRLAPLEAQPGEQADFALRETSLPAPRTGVTVKEPFPPPAAGPRAPEVAAGPLTVLRKLPTGDVPLAPHLSITFSQPMVAVTSVAESQKTQPAKLEPQPQGQWRWVGAKTLLFESQPRLPMATEYLVTVPAGTRAPGGGALPETVSWTFRTPPLGLRVKHPEGGPARRDTLLFAGFDQAVDAQALLASLSVRAGRASAKLRLATVEEVEADAAVRALVRAAEKQRYVVFKPVEPLPADSAVEVSVEAGAPSAEGPRRTAAAQSWGFRTYGPLRVSSSRCGWGEGPCRPFVPWQVEFTNPLDVKAFTKEMLKVEPELPGLKVSAGGNTLSIQGASRGRTAYKVTLAPSVPDVFGQTLERAETLTFEVSTAEQTLTWSGGDFIVLDPAAKPGVSVYTVNVPELRVEAWGVTPGDWRAHVDSRGRRFEKGNTPPGRKLLSTLVKPKAQPDELTETRVDLASLFPNGLGHAVVRVEPTVQPKEQWRRMGFQAWVQGTRIGLSAFGDGDELLGWATSLADGQPLAGVELALEPGGPRAATDATGLGRLALGPEAASAPLLVARRGADAALLPETPYWWNAQHAWRGSQRADRVAWYVADDRGLYRPGEKVHVKGWARRIGGGPQGEVDLLQQSGEFSWSLKDSRANELAKGSAKLDALGGFELLLELPPSMNLGQATLQLDASATGLAQNAHQHAFQVQEFRRPEFEVTASASEGPHVVGEHAEVTLSASYYAGGGLPGADVDWQVQATPSTYTPPGRGDYVFGEWLPWWGLRARPTPEPRTQTFKARTDASGKHVLRVDFDAAKPPRPTSLQAEGTVADVNRQAFTGTAALLVHPALLYVGLKSGRMFVQQGEPLVVQGIVSDIEGALVAGRRVSVRAERLEWEQQNGEWVETVAASETCDWTSAKDAATCRFRTAEGGAYRVTAQVQDEQGRTNETRLRLWVAGGKQPQRRNVEQEKLELIPSKKEYRPGETAEILVLAPWSPAEGLVTLRREGLVRSERFTLTGSSHTLRLKVEDGYTPNVHLQVDLNGAAPRSAPHAAGAAQPALPTRPAYASGQLDLQVPPLARTLALEVSPRDKRLEPGGRTSVHVTLKDAQGRPVAGGQVAVIVADEAVLALTRYALPDPLAVFYPRRAPDVSNYYSRPYVVLGRLEDLDLSQLQQLDELKTLAYADGAVAGIAGGAPGVPQAPPASMPLARRMKMAAPQAEAEPAAPEPIRMRSDFSALALFAAALPTDARGHAQVALQLPDNLTRYRVMAVAVAGGRQYGSGESSVQARLPLMVRPSPPRFLNFGDRFELPVVVQNQTDTALDVQVAVRATNAELTAGAGRRLRVPPNDRVEVRFPASAQLAGSARFQLAAVSGRFADAAEFKLPVWTPATTEAFATYGTLDEGAVAQPVAAPPGVVPGFGGLEVTTSSTALQALTDAVLYLSAYPFECSEQLASRILAVAALKDVLAAFKAEGLPAPADLLAAVDRDLARLRALQNDDGGFGFWRRGDEPWPYLGVHVAHAFERARTKGFKVPDETWSRSQAYLKSIETHIPSSYGSEARRTLSAYALYVRQRMGDPDPARARQLLAESALEKTSFEALGWLLPVLATDPASRGEAAAIRKHLANRVEETAAAAHFVVSYGDGAHLLLHSDRRADAVLLEALIATDPQNDLIPKLVTGLLAHRRAGRWGNTQENAFVLLALDRYFAAYERATPDFVARLWLGERFAGQQAYRGRSTARHLLEVPMSVLARTAGAQPLTIAKDGPGRLYYRVGLRYAPAALKLEPLDAGFTVERSYAALDDPKDVRRDADGAWHVRAGARVRVKLALVAPARRYHVALVDPMPAGLEALNPALATTGSLPAGGSSDVTVLGAPGLGAPGRVGLSYWWWTRPWFEHQNLRDERVEAFSSLLWEGVWDYSYVARATTPGTFVVPPAKAEEMYAPETFGRSGTDRLVVE